MIKKRGKAVAKAAQKAAEKILDLIYPVRCPFCDRPVLPKEGYVCDKCRENIRVVRQPYCMKCGKPLRQEEKEYCGDCNRIEHGYDRGRFLLVYEGRVRESVYRFKYGKRREYAKAYGQWMEQELGEFVRLIRPDALIPVPLHKKRFRKRGYNQAEELAKEIGRRMKVPVYTSYVQREKNTKPQKELDFSGRQNNLKKAFKITRNDVKLNTTIIIDDIYTTGSTVDALSAELKAAGVQKVFFLCLAGGK